jgi:excisionase family DNA binding protein
MSKSKLIEPKEQMLTVSEVAASLRIESNTLRIWIRQGRFPGWIKIGREWRISPSKLDQFKSKGN